MALDKGTAKSVLSKTFVEDNDEVNEDEALGKIFNSLARIKDMEDTRAADDRLNAAKQVVKDLNEGYTSVIKNEKAKISFLRDKVSEIRAGEVNPTASV